MSSPDWPAEFGSGRFFTLGLAYVLRVMSSGSFMQAMKHLDGQHAGLCDSARFRWRADGARTQHQADLSEDGRQESEDYAFVDQFADLMGEWCRRPGSWGESVHWPPRHSQVWMAWDGSVGASASTN